MEALKTLEEDRRNGILPGPVRKKGDYVDGDELQSANQPETFPINEAQAETLIFIVKSKKYKIFLILLAFLKHWI